MPDPISSILSGGISGIADAFQKIVGTFKLSPEQKAAIDAATEANREKLAELDAQYKVKILDSEVSLNETAGQNIRAEASSDSKFVSWARPGVIWTGNVAILWNYCVVPVFGHHWQMQPVNIPDLVWEIWCACVLGYIVSRTGQDVFGKVLGGSGGTAQLPFGIKMESKGD